MNFIRLVAARALKKYGRTCQEDIALEEMAELTQALYHYRRKKCEVEDVVSEIADVFLVLESLAIIYGYEEVEKVIEEKAARLRNRISEEGDGLSTVTGAPSV